MRKTQTSSGTVGKLWPEFWCTSFTCSLTCQSLSESLVSSPGLHRQRTTKVNKIWWHVKTYWSKDIC